MVKRVSSRIKGKMSVNKNQKKAYKEKGKKKDVKNNKVTTKSRGKNIPNRKRAN